MIENKLYLVIYRDYECFVVLGIYDNKDVAQKRALNRKEYFDQEHRAFCKNIIDNIKKIGFILRV